MAKIVCKHLSEMMRAQQWSGNWQSGCAISDGVVQLSDNRILWAGCAAIAACCDNMLQLQNDPLFQPIITILKIYCMSLFCALLFISSTIIKFVYAIGAYYHTRNMEIVAHAAAGAVDMGVWWLSNILSIWSEKLPKTTDLVVMGIHLTRWGINPVRNRYGSKKLFGGNVPIKETTCSGQVAVEIPGHTLMIHCVGTNFYIIAFI